MKYMAKYSVPITDYDTFKNATITKSFDVDGCYGTQCWDLPALLYTQFPDNPRTFSRGGTGAAKGTVNEKARAVNTGTEFEFISDLKKLQRGDIFVSGAGTYGHTGFVDTDPDLAKGTSTQFAQNIGGTAGEGTAAYAKVKAEFPISVIIGGYRYKPWHKTTNNYTQSEETDLKEIIATTTWNVRGTPTAKGIGGWCAI